MPHLVQRLTSPPDPLSANGEGELVDASSFGSATSLECCWSFIAAASGFVIAVRGEGGWWAFKGADEMGQQEQECLPGAQRLVGVRCRVSRLFQVDNGIHRRIIVVLNCESHFYVPHTKVYHPLCKSA